MNEFDVAGFLGENEEVILTDATIRLARAHLTRYQEEGVASYAARLRSLLETVIECCEKRNLQAADAYADSLASARQPAGYSLAELQTAINVLEESTWHTITEEVPAGSVAFALGMISTCLGEIKDRIARDYLAREGMPDGGWGTSSLFEGSR